MSGGTTWTPGPWAFEHNEADGHYDINSQHTPIGSEAIGQVLYVNNKPGGRGECDARLIAATPELYDALLGVMDILGRAESNASGNPEWDHVGPRVAAARAALAKARGEA